MIKVLVPYMPTADQLVPYLREMDESKVYTNNGPLARRLEAQLSTQLQIPCVSVANATLGLELALKALPGKDRWVVPTSALTFRATQCAIVNAGLAPAYVDVAPDSWSLHPNAVAGSIAAAEYAVKAVVPVAAYGRPLVDPSWNRFAEKTGLPVVIDAAGCLPAYLDGGLSDSYCGRLAVVFSLHATKGVGAGEGGIVCSHDKDLISKVRGTINFQGYGATNGKLSEYHAAVALASLTVGFRKERALKMNQVVRWYQLNWPSSLSDRFFGSSLLVAKLPARVRFQDVTEAALNRGVELRQWYSPFYDEAALEQLPVARELRNRLIGLPYHAHLSEDDVAHVCDTMKEVLK